MQTLLNGLLVGTVFLLCSSYQVASASEKFVRDDGQEIIDAGNRTIAVLLEKFRAASPIEHHELLTKEKIRVNVAADFNAFADPVQRRILIPAQFVAENLAQVHGLIIYLRKPTPSLGKKYTEWLKYLSDRSYKARLRFVRKDTIVDSEPVTHFWYYANLPEPGPLTQKEAWAQERMMIDILALVLGHELGHVVYKHPHPKTSPKVSPATMRKYEYQADEFASKLLAKAGISLLPGLTTAYIRFAGQEALDKGVSPEEKTHPPAPCRFYRLLDVEIQRQMPLSAEDKMNFERASNMSIHDLFAAIKSSKAECLIED